MSSASSEDYIIILPECFDTSRPLGESMYSSALSQPSLERAIDAEMEMVIPEGESQPQVHNINDILTTSQTLDAVPLTPEIVGTLPQLQRYGGCGCFCDKNKNAKDGISMSVGH